MSKMKELQARLAELNAQAAAIQCQIDAENAKIAAKRRDIILDALIVGCDMAIRHGSIAPYSNGYYVSSHLVNESFCRTVSSCEREWWIHIPQKMCEYLVKQRAWTDKEFASLKRRTTAMWNQLPDRVVAGKAPTVANGYELTCQRDVVLGRCGGTWSTYTTTAQNDLSRSLIALKGYCVPDYYGNRGITYAVPADVTKAVLKRHSIVFENSSQFEKDYPLRCGIA